MVDPNLVSAIKRDGIATPDELVIQVANLDVLNDDILATGTHPQAFAFDDSLVTNSNDGFVGRNIDGGFRSVVPRSRLLCRVAAIILYDPLTATTGSPAGTNSTCCSALGFGEIEFLVQDYDSRDNISEHVSQLVNVGRVVWRRITAARHAICKPFGCASHLLGRSQTY